MQLREDTEGQTEFAASGFDEIDAPLFGAITLGLGVLAGLAAPRGVWTAPLVLLAVGSALVAAGSRYSLRISSRGIELTSWRAWILPFRQRYLLDADVELYEALDADRPEGLCIRPLLGWGEQETECFGPHFSQERLLELHGRAREALFRARSALRMATTTPNFNGAPALAGALDDTQRRYWPLNGRLKSARLARPVTVDSVVLPVGSTIEVNTGEYMDPRRLDQLNRVILSGPCALPLPDLPRAQAGAELCLDPRLRVHSARKAFSGRIELPGGAIVDGLADLSWDDEGALDRFTLGAPLVVGDLSIPAGSRFHAWRLGRRRRWWYVNPAAQIRLPQLTIDSGGSLLVTPSFSRLVGAMVDRDLTIEGCTLAGGVLHLPLDSSLRVDLQECRRRGLVRGRQ